jgi:CBS-domain-containing membrane protein
MLSRFELIDHKLRRNLPAYVGQCLLATVALFVVLSLEDALARAVVIAAIGSTAFVLFITPHSDMASPRHVIGGHAIALAAGAVAASFGGDGAIAFALEGALAVGVALFLMAATNTEHAPAAGTALGVVTHGSSWSLALLLVASIAALVLIHRVLRPWLRDLY